MPNRVQLFDVVALTKDQPQAGLVRGQVATVVEKLAEEIFILDFSDDDGQTYAWPIVSGGDLMVLRFQQEQAA